MTKNQSRKRPTPFSAHRIGVQMRVSSEQQRNESQELFMRQAFDRLGMAWPPDAYVFREKESAYKRKNFERREALRASVEAIERGELRGIMFLNVSRVSRYLKDGERWYERIERAGGRVIFAERPEVDIFTHSGRDWFVEELADAERYSLRLSQRIRRGRAYIADQNRRMPGRQGFGATMVRGELAWTKDAEIVKAAITMAHGGATIAEICADIKRRHGRTVAPKTVRVWLHAPRYYGMHRNMPLKYGTTYHTAEAYRAAELRPAPWRGIVPAEWYEPIQRMLFERSRQGRGGHAKTHERYVLGAGYLRCAHCGGALVGEQKNGRDCYTCGWRGHWPRRERCEAGRKGAPVADIMAQLGEIISSIRPTRAVIAAATQTMRQMRQQPARPVADTAAARAALGADVAFGRISIAEFKRRMADLDRKESERVARPPKPVDYARVAASMATMADAWARSTEAQRGEIVRRLFAMVVVDVVVKRVTRLETDETIGVMLRAVPRLRARDKSLTVYDVAE